VGSRENVNPKKDLRPPFFGSFFGRAKNEQIIVGKLKNSRPKIICSLDFSLVTFFLLRKRK